MSAVQPSLCLALTSAPSDNSLERDRGLLDYHGPKSGRNETVNKQGGWMNLEIEAFEN